MLSVQLPKTALGAQDDAPGLVVDHKVLSLYGYKTSAVKKYKTNPPPPMFPVNGKPYRQVHPVAKVNYMTLAQASKSHLAI